VIAIVVLPDCLGYSLRNRQKRKVLAIGTATSQLAQAPEQTTAVLADWVRDARQRSIELIFDLTDDQLVVPKLSIINPLLWEIGHVAWFQEKWVLRRGGLPSRILSGSDQLYDSIALEHGIRWDLPILSRPDTLSYVAQVRDAVIERIDRGDLDAQDIYFLLLAIFHEDMHTEAFTYTRQTLAYPAPQFSENGDRHGNLEATGALSGDVEVPGGTYCLGAAPNEPFVFDNEKWAHPVEVQPFAISRCAVTQAEFADFVAAGGYRRAELWHPDGWRWRLECNAEHPVYWRRASSTDWQRRDFNRWVALEPNCPVLHVNWYEADAYCRWAGRRLPSEVEWELAASGLPSVTATGARLDKRRFPWGDGAATPYRANLDWRAMGCLDVAALPQSDSFWGCRQMIGNTWEWTASDFLPFPGFVADPYKEYSTTSFGTHKVLRGGCWVTRARLIRNTWRNFYTPDRRDVWAGFRTCAVRV
jgi:iron(II)-dependent oxidoreductase